MHSGVDWPAVEAYTMTPEDYAHFKDPSRKPPARFHWYWPLSWGTAAGNPVHGFLKHRRRKQARRASMKHGFQSHDSVRYFGRQGSGPTSEDLESGLSGYSVQGMVYQPL